MALPTHTQLKSIPGPRGLPLPNYWPDPERFDPQRFMPENIASRPRHVYSPFGEGPHLCIGNNFALMESS